MSFTDGKPFVATAQQCAARWGGAAPGERFRCYMCGHRFEPGDVARWQYTNNLPGHYGGNPFVCARCDGPDVVDRWKALCDEAHSARFWSFFDR